MELAQSPSNRRPITVQSRNQFAASLVLRKPPKGHFSSSPRKQNQRDVRGHHATSKLIVNSLPFRGPISGSSFTNLAVQQVAAVPKFRHAITNGPRVDLEALMPTWPPISGEFEQRDSPIPVQCTSITMSEEGSRLAMRSILKQTL